MQVNTPNDPDETVAEALAAAANRIRSPLPSAHALSAIERATDDVGVRIRTLREQAGLSQAEFAREVSELLPGSKWHQTTVGKVEAGTRPIKLDEGWAVALVLRLSSLNDLAFGQVGADLHELMMNASAETEVYRARAAMALVRRGLEAAGVPKEQIDAALADARQHLPTPAQDIRDYADAAAWVAEIFARQVDRDLAEAGKLEERILRMRETASHPEGFDEACGNDDGRGANR